MILCSEIVVGVILEILKMNLDKKLRNLIKKKTQEIEMLEKEMHEKELAIREAKAYIQALEDTQKHLPYEGDSKDEVSIRPGSSIDKVMKVLKEAGEPLYITDILEKIGREANKSGRQALSGQLANYVRQGRIFTRTAPNTFGLTEWGKNQNDPEEPDDDGASDMPDDFGVIRSL